MALLAQIEYISDFYINDKEFVISNYIVDCANKNQADIILLASYKNNKKLNKSLEEVVDINIRFETNKTIICIISGANFYYQFEYSDSHDDILALYHRIIEYYN